MANAAKVFVYTGEGEGARGDALYAAVHVCIDPAVLVIPEYFIWTYRSKLEEVELHSNVREIGHRAFRHCTVLEKINVLDGVEIIGAYAFYACKFTKFRSPPLITTIPNGMLGGCRSMFSLELSKQIIQVEQHAIGSCMSLRNISLASNTVVDNRAFRYCQDLLHIFDTQEAIVNALKIRFVKLPFHSKMYYISYHNTLTDESICNTSLIGENGDLGQTGLQQDCLGMTVLHILACSTVRCLELYRLIVDKYPANLIVEDAWGAVPLLYAVWGDAPSEILRFLVTSYQSLYPHHKFNWTFMVRTLGQANAPAAVIRNLLDLQQNLSPRYIINWNRILRELAATKYTSYPKQFAFFLRLDHNHTFCVLARCSIATRVSAIGVKHFRDAIANDWTDYNYRHRLDRQRWHTDTLAQLEYYESEYRKLKEMTSLLELALWKATLDKEMGDGSKKLKMKSDFRLQCRTSCGADYVIENVWRYLLPRDFVHSYDVYGDYDDYEDDAISRAYGMLSSP